VEFNVHSLRGIIGILDKLLYGDIPSETKYEVLADTDFFLVNKDGKLLVRVERDKLCESTS
jgi:hypothetical protein